MERLSCWRKSESSCQIWIMYIMIFNSPPPNYLRIKLWWFNFPSTLYLKQDFISLKRKLKFWFKTTNPFIVKINCHVTAQRFISNSRDRHWNYICIQLGFIPPPKAWQIDVSLWKQLRYESQLITNQNSINHIVSQSMNKWINKWINK